MAGQVKREYEAQGKKMKRYLEKVKEIMESFDKVILTKIPQKENNSRHAHSNCDRRKGYNIRLTGARFGYTFHWSGRSDSLYRRGAR